MTSSSNSSQSTCPTGYPLHYGAAEIISHVLRCHSRLLFVVPCDQAVRIFGIGRGGPLLGTILTVAGPESTYKQTYEQKD